MGMMLLDGMFTLLTGLWLTSVIYRSHRFEIKSISNKVKARLENVILSRLVTNGGLWTLDSFSKLRDNVIPSYRSGANVYGNFWWILIVAVSYPFCLYFLQMSCCGDAFEFWDTFFLNMYKAFGLQNTNVICYMLYL